MQDDANAKTPSTPGGLVFRGWWEFAEKGDCPDPWETFEIVLLGREAGDFARGAEVEGILTVSGYRIRLEAVEAEADAG